MMHRSSSTNCCHRGLTLIEVVAGLALMGTLVAAMLSAKSRFTGQYHYAQRVLTAVDAMDALLVDRWPTIGAIENNESGIFDDQKDLMWRVSVVDDNAAADWHSRVVRVQVLDSLGEPGDPPLASVDLLVPDLPRDLTQEAPPQDMGQEETDIQDPDAVQSELSLFDEVRSDSTEPNRSVGLESESPVFGEGP